MGKLLLLISLFSLSCSNYEKLIESELIKQNNGIDIKYKSKDLKKEILSVTEVKQMLIDSLSNFNGSFATKDKNIDPKDFELLTQYYHNYIRKYGTFEPYAVIINHLDSVSNTTTRDDLATYNTLYEYAYYTKKMIDDGLDGGWSYVNSEYLSNILKRLQLFVKYENELKDIDASSKKYLTKVTNRYKIYDHTIMTDRYSKTVCYFDNNNNVIYFQVTPDIK